MRAPAVCRWILLLLGIGLWAGAATADARPEAVLLDADWKPHQALGGQLWVQEDSRNTLDVQAALAGPWQAPDGSLRSRGYTQSAFWFRVRLRNGLHHPVPWLFTIEEPDLQRIELHVFGEQGELRQSWQTGAEQPFHLRPFHHRNFVFPLVFQPGETLEVVFRVKTDGALLVPVYLTEQFVFAQREQGILLVLGLILGGMLILVLYHTYMYASAGGFRHLLLGLYIGSLLFFMISVKGLGYQFLWPDRVAFNELAVRLFAWMSILWGVCYLLEFFEVRRRYPRLIWLAVLFLLMFTVLYGVSMYRDSAGIGQSLRLFHLVAFTLYLLLAARLWWRGAIAERYLGLSLFAMFAAGLVFVLYTSGYVDYSRLAVSSLDYGLALAAGFLTLSLAEQIRQERIQQEMAFHRMLSQESELRAIREDALDQQEQENQRLQRQVRVRDSELSLVIGHLKESHARLENVANVDGLTGLHNLRSFRSVLQAVSEQAAVEREPLALLLINLDDFRAFNQQHGHVLGDEVLRVIAVLISAIATRPSDVLARSGGEEFSVLLPNTELEGALVVAERIRRLVCDHGMVPSGAAEATVRVSLSIGVASLVPESGADGEMLVNQARLALQRAKREGKNQVSCFDFGAEGLAEN